MTGEGSTPWIGPTVGRWGHWGATWLIGCIVAVIGLGLRPITAGTPLAVLAPLAVFGFALLGWLAMRRHDRNLCEICVLAMPLNLSAVAARYKTQFAVVHAGSKRTLVIAYLVVLVGSDVVLRGDTPLRVCWAVIQSSMIYLVLAYSSHRRFQPWCPQCQGGHGEDDHAAWPVPLPQGGRSR